MFRSLCLPVNGDPVIRGRPGYRPAESTGLAGKVTYAPLTVQPSTTADPVLGDRVRLDVSSALASGPQPKQEVPAELLLPDPQADPLQDLRRSLEAIRVNEEYAMAETFSLTVEAWNIVLAQPKSFCEALDTADRLQDLAARLTKHLEALRQRKTWAERTLQETARAGDLQQVQDRVRAELFLNSAIRQIESMEEAMAALRKWQAALEEVNDTIQQRVQQLGLVNAILQEDFGLSAETLEARGFNRISQQGMSDAMKALLSELGMPADDAAVTNAWAEIRAFVQSNNKTRGPVLEKVLQREQWLLTFDYKDIYHLRQLNGGSFTRRDLEQAVASERYPREQKETFRKLLSYPELFKALDTARYGPGGENDHVGPVDLDAFAGVIGGRSGRIFLPTFYDARRDAEILHRSSSASGWGDLLWNRNAVQRAQIIMTYQERYGKDLGQAIEEKFSYHGKGYVLFLLERRDHEEIVRGFQSWPADELGKYMDLLRNQILSREKGIRRYDKEVPFYLSNLYRDDPWAHRAIRNAEAAWSTYRRNPTEANKQSFINALATLETESKKVYRIYDTALSDRSNALGTALTVARFIRDTAIAAEVALLTGGLATGSLAVGGSAAWGTAGRVGFSLALGTGAGTVMRSAARLQDNWVTTGKASLSWKDVAGSAGQSALDAGLSVLLGVGLPKLAQVMQAAKSSRFLNRMGKAIDKLAVADAVDPRNIPIKVIGTRVAFGAVTADLKQVATNLYNQRPLTEDLWKSTVDGALRGVSGTVRK